MKEKINHSSKIDDDSFKDTGNYSTPNDIIKDDKIRKILSSSETPVSHVRYSGKLFGGKYDKIVITNQRIIFYKTTGTFSKKIKCESVPLDKLGFPTIEEKGLISKKAILKVEIGMEEPLRWEGKPTDIQGLNQQILNVVRR